MLRVEVAENSYDAEDDDTYFGWTLGCWITTVLENSKKSEVYYSFFKVLEIT